MSRYTRAGKQVLCDGQHMADCTDEAAAMTVCNALLAMEELSAASPTFADAFSYGYDVARKPDESSIARYNMMGGNLALLCTARRETDEYACSCGLRWGVDEDDPH